MPNILTYIPTYINISGLQGGYVAIYDNNGTRQYYQNTEGISELPFSATGTWSYSIARYQYKLVTGTFTVDRTTGGTVIIAPSYALDIYVADTAVENVSAYTEFFTTQNIYDYLSYYRTTSEGINYGDLNSYISGLNIGSKNLLLSSDAVSPFNYDGTTFSVKCIRLSGTDITTTGDVTLDLFLPLQDIRVAATNVYQTIADDLYGVTINGILHYNMTGYGNWEVTLFDTTISTVVNDGEDIIAIRRFNSSINNASDPEIDSYAPTIINVAPDGGSFALYNDTGSRTHFIQSNYTIILPGDASGTWAYRIAKYGFDSIYQQFTINRATGATINVFPNYVADPFITDTLQNVQNYTNLNTVDKIHDYLSYFQTLSTGIDYGNLETESFGSITFTGALALSGDASEMVSLSGNTLVLKSTSLTDDVSLVVGGNLYQRGGNTISDGIKVRATNLDSEFYFSNVDLLVFYPTEADRNNNTNAGPTISSETIYRFLYGSTVQGVTFEDFIYCRVTVGGITLLNTTALQTGSTTIDFGTTGNLQTILNNQKIINAGVQKASKLIPHATNI